MSFAIFRTTKNALESIHDEGGISRCFQAVFIEPELQSIIDNDDDENTRLQQQQKKEKEKERSFRLYSKRRSTTHFD